MDIALKTTVEIGKRKCQERVPKGKVSIWERYALMIKIQDTGRVFKEKSWVGLDKHHSHLVSDEKFLFSI